MATDGERIDKFAEGVFLTMNHDKVFENFEKELLYMKAKRSPHFVPNF